MSIPPGVASGCTRHDRFGELPAQLRRQVLHPQTVFSLLASEMFSVIKRHGIYLLGGYLVLFLLLLHYPDLGNMGHPGNMGAPGILALQPIGYLQATEHINPFGASRLFKVMLLVVLSFLSIVYIHLIRIVRSVRPIHGYLGVTIAGTILFSIPLLASPYILSQDAYAYIFYGRMSALYDDNPMINPPLLYMQDPFFKYVSMHHNDQLVSAQ